MPGPSEHVPAEGVGDSEEQLEVDHSQVNAAPDECDQRRAVDVEAGAGTGHTLDSAEMNSSRQRARSEEQVVMEGFARLESLGLDDRTD